MTSAAHITAITQGHNGKQLSLSDLSRQSLKIRYNLMEGEKSATWANTLWIFYFKISNAMGQLALSSLLHFSDDVN